MSKHRKHVEISFIDTNLIHNFFFINYIKLRSSALCYIIYDARPTNLKTWRFVCTMSRGNVLCVWVEEVAAFLVLLLQARKTWENGWMHKDTYFHHLQLFRSAVSSKWSSKQSAIWCFLCKCQVPSYFFKVVRQLLKSSSWFSRHFCPSFCISFDYVL